MVTMCSIVRGAVIAALTAGLTMSAVAANVYSFNRISGDNGTPGSSFTATIQDLGAGKASFTFENNTGETDAKIFGIYFSTGFTNWLTNPIFGSPLNDASNSAGSKGLPGGGSYGLFFSNGLNANGGRAFEAKNGQGVTDGNSWTVTFDLVTSYAAMIAAIEAGFGVPGDAFDGGTHLIIGLKGIGLMDDLGRPGEGSTEYVMHGDPPIIPLPPAAWMGLAGLAGVAFARRRRLIG